MALDGYEIIHEAKTLDTNFAALQGRSLGVASGKRILSGGYYDGAAYGRPPLTIAYAFTTDGTTFVWGFMCNDPSVRTIDCYVIVADA